MGHQGKDVSTPHGAWGRQTPWQSSSDDYPDDGSGGPGYGPGDGYPGQGQPGYASYGQQDGYGQQDERYGDPYGQQPHAGQYGQPYQQRDGYEPGGGGTAGGWGAPGDGWGGTAGGYGGQREYGQGDHSYERGPGSGGYPQGGYNPAPTPGYGQSGGYRGPAGGYQGPAGGGYPGHDASYQDQHVGYGQSGGYQAQQPSGGYQAQQPSGGHRALPAGPAGLAAIRRRTLEMTGTAASPTLRVAGASLTPARTSSTGAPSMSTARARAAHCVIRCAATPLAPSKTPASSLRP